nr:protein HOTHEAD-like [Tanacetum cinerariifolium]
MEDDDLSIKWIKKSLKYNSGNYTFLYNATQAPSVSFYDYIIIGGGTAGIPLATTLSANYSVLLLERGGSPYDNPNVTDVVNFGLYFLDNSSSSPSQEFIVEGVVNARPRVLGGGTAINAGFYSRGEVKFNMEAKLTDEDLILDSYEWAEKVMVFEPVVRAWQSAVHDGLLDVGVTPDNGFTYDHIVGTKVGGTLFDQLGKRHTAADLLQFANPETLSVLLYASVHKILFNTKEQLDALKINRVLEQPFVGKDVADNPLNGLFIPSPIAVEKSTVQLVGITPFGSYIEEAGATNLIFANVSAYQGFNPEMGGFIVDKIDGPLSKGELTIEK